MISELHRSFEYQRTAGTPSLLVIWLSGNVALGSSDDRRDGVPAVREVHV
jgi:hypothetical protein